jgi:hypothetical protein
MTGELRKMVVPAAGYEPDADPVAVSRSMIEGGSDAMAAEDEVEADFSFPFPIFPFPIPLALALSFGLAIDVDSTVAVEDTEAAPPVNPS